MGYLFLEMFLNFWKLLMGGLLQRTTIPAQPVLSDAFHTFADI